MKRRPKRAASGIRAGIQRASPSGARSGKKLYEEVTDKVREWNQARHNAGLVVGATKPEELRDLRAGAPELPFLIPVVGAQGSTSADVKAGNGNGLALVNISRGIAGASNAADFAEAARAAAMKFVEE